MLFSCESMQIRTSWFLKFLTIYADIFIFNLLNFQIIFIQSVSQMRNIYHS